jgi:large subunit ribosomal protein L13
MIKKEKVHSFDAQGQSIGRLAAQIAVILQGKHRADYLPHQDKGEEVVVKNVAQMKITGQKREDKKYYHHSGYPGGIKSISLGELMEKKPGEVLKKAVWNMLPKNKLRSQRIKKLKFE